MRDIEKQVFQLITVMLLAEEVYDHLLKSDSQDLESLNIRHAKQQKNLQIKELCRLFQINENDLMLRQKHPPKNIISNAETNSIAYQSVLSGEVYIQDLYSQIINRNDISAFESMVMNNHLKEQKSLIRKLSNVIV